MLDVHLFDILYMPDRVRHDGEIERKEMFCKIACRFELTKHPSYVMV